MADRVWMYADLLIWSLVAGLWWPGISKAGERLGWRIGRWQLDRMHQIERLHELQWQLQLLRCSRYCGSPLMVSAAMERHRRRMSEGGYDC